MNDIELTLVTLLLPFLISLAGALFVLIVPQDKQKQIEQIVGKVVRSVEQSMPGATPEEKKANAIKIVNALLKASKLPVDPQMIDMLIEEAVFSLPPTNSAGAGVPVLPGN